MAPCGTTRSPRARGDARREDRRETELGAAAGDGGDGGGRREVVARTDDSAVRKQQAKPSVASVGGGAGYSGAKRRGSSGAARAEADVKGVDKDMVTAMAEWRERRKAVRTTRR